MISNIFGELLTYSSNTINICQQLAQSIMGAAAPITTGMFFFDMPYDNLHHRFAYDTLNDRWEFSCALVPVPMPQPHQQPPPQPQPQPIEDDAVDDLGL